jgi:CHASE1-domain containing sensor protein
METLSFAFGVLTMIGVALAAVVVVGIVKVLKMEKRLQELHRWHESDNMSMHQRISNELESIHRSMSDDRKEMNDRVDHLNSYVDSRLDKLESKFIGNSAKKQIIND